MTELHSDFLPLYCFLHPPTQYLPLMRQMLNFISFLPSLELCVYGRGGAMLQGMSAPGFHMMVPFITSGTVRGVERGVFYNRKG